MKPTPEFAIYQNSRTKQSGVWNGKRWAHPPIEHYEHLRLLAILIRTDPDPVGIMKSIMKADNNPPQDNKMNAEEQIKQSD